VPRIVLDTHLLVSAFVAPGGVAARAFLVARARFRLCFSAAMEVELRGVLMRPKFRRYGASAEAVAGFRGALLVRADRVEPVEAVKAVTDCRDAKDNMVLEAALAGGAGVIVSGDADLLVLNPWRGVAVLSAGAFVAGFDG
jgi:uncharacterized protein